METYREYIGNLHTHTVYSDGAGDHAALGQAAEEAGIHFVITTDHNVWVSGIEGYQGRTLVLVGEELHNVCRQPQANHLLVYGAEQELAPYSFGSPHTLIKTANERGGFCYIAHPCDKGSPIGPELQGIPWVDWPVEGVTGLEIWNHLSELKGLLWSKLAAVIYAYFPEWGIRGPRRNTLRLWDEMLGKGQRLAAIGNADAHAQWQRLGPFKRVVFPYSYHFRCVNTHILARDSLTGELPTDKSIIYEALRAGRTWVGYDLPHPTQGFRFTARSGSAQATVGQELKRLGALSLEVETPAPGHIRLLRDGKVLHRTTGTQLRHTSADAGVYRVEVYRRFKGRQVGWIFSSPIYVI